MPTPTHHQQLVVQDSMIYVVEVIPGKQLNKSALIYTIRFFFPIKYCTNENKTLILFMEMGNHKILASHYPILNN